VQISLFSIRAVGRYADIDLLPKLGEDESTSGDESDDEVDEYINISNVVIISTSDTLRYERLINNKANLK